MLISDYVAAALRTVKPMPDRAGDLEHAALGLMTEAGNLAAHVRRLRVDHKGINLEQLAEDVGDVLSYCAVAAQHLLDFHGATFAKLEDGTVLHEDNTPLDQRLSMLMLRLGANVGEFGALSHVGDLAEAAVRVQDALACLAGTCKALGLRLEHCAQYNIDKHRVRHPELFIDARVS